MLRMMARYLIDTNIFTFVATEDFDSLTADVQARNQI